MANWSCTGASSCLLVVSSLLLLFHYLSPQNENYIANIFGYSGDAKFSPESISIPPSTATDKLNISSPIKKKRGLNMIENDLAEARAAIREAIRSQNNTSDKEETFVPKGSIYRNAVAFHQSYIEMEKRFKIWSYSEGEQPMFHSGPMNGIYAIEGHILDEIENNKRFKAHHPDEAHTFLIPISVSKSVDTMYRPKPEQFRDRMMHVFFDYTRIVYQKYQYWNRSNGADHFLVSCHDWAPGLVNEDPVFFKNFIRVLCNANTSEGFHPIRDVSVPEYHLVNNNLGPPLSSKSLRQRTKLAFFAGGPHGDIRDFLFEHWLGKDKDVEVHQYLEKGSDYNKLLSDTKFCLCPSGSEVASPRVIEALYAGCIPVLISHNYSIPFSDVLDWNNFSLEIPVEKIPEIKSILMAVSERRYMKLQQNVLRVRRHFMVNRPAKPYDVFHMFLHSLWLRRINVRLPN